MATAELTASASTRRLLNGLQAAWPRAYGAIWLATLGSALLVSLLGAAAKARVRGLLGLRLDPGQNAPPELGHILVLVAHNLPIAAWPVLLGVIGAHQHRLGRRVADVVLLACILANTLPVGAALGAYGTRLLAYIPQLPLEWAGLALGVSAWLLQRRRPLSVSEGLALTTLIATVLLCAAIVETDAVPHRGVPPAPRQLPTSMRTVLVTAQIAKVGTILQSKRSSGRSRLTGATWM
jgi:hypothetical protein